MYRKFGLELQKAKLFDVWKTTRHFATLTLLRHITSPHLSRGRPMRQRVLINRTSSDFIYQILCHFIQRSFFGEVTHLRSYVFSRAEKECRLWWSDTLAKWRFCKVTCRSDASVAKWYLPRLPVWKNKHNPQAENVCIHIQV